MFDLVFFVTSFLWELPDKTVLENLQFWAQILGAMLELCAVCDSFGTSRNVSL